MNDFNQRFAYAPGYLKNLHRAVTEKPEEIDDIFSWQETRKLTEVLTFHYDKMIYLFEPTEKILVLQAKTSKSMTILMESVITILVQQKTERIYMLTRSV